jgi:hypothetical protein
MRNIRIKRLIAIGCTGLILASSLAGNAVAQAGRSEVVRTSVEKVHEFGSPNLIPQAGALLARKPGGVFSQISTSALPAGEVVTLWWVIFNSPSHCATTTCGPTDLDNPLVLGSLQYGGGAIVGPSGRADFSGFLGLNDNTGFYVLPQFPNMPNPAPGLLSSKDAVVHLVIRKHGPASSDPETLRAQLYTFTGGCSVPNACANVQAAAFVP